MWASWEKHFAEWRRFLLENHILRLEHTDDFVLARKKIRSGLTSGLSFFDISMCTTATPFTTGGHDSFIIQQVT
jgi:hypothetical protein